MVLPIRLEEKLGEDIPGVCDALVGKLPTMKNGLGSTALCLLQKAQDSIFTMLNSLVSSSSLPCKRDVDTALDMNDFMPIIGTPRRKVDAQNCQRVQRSFSGAHPINFSTLLCTPPLITILESCNARPIGVSVHTFDGYDGRKERGGRCQLRRGRKKLWNPEFCPVHKIYEVA